MSAVSVVRLKVSFENLSYLFLSVLVVVSMICPDLKVNCELQELQS